jgi:predicted dehydrogenase
VDQIFQTPGPTKLVAVADAFEDRISACLEGLSRTHGDKVSVPADHRFVGFDGYQEVLQCNIDVVVLATPPGFRPLHFEAAVQAKKHIFMEKPVAVDVPGVRRVLHANEHAKANNLMVAVGLQRHHEPNYHETIARLQEGAIGEILLTRAYWNSGGLWVRERKPEWTEMEYQMRNWYYFNWLCGDHIVEQHIHNMDVINWLMDDYPISANGQGGREVRTGLDYGQIFDHHFVEFTYANGAKMFSQCRHIDGCWNSVSEFAHGTKGSADISGARILSPTGSPIWSFKGNGGNGHQQEQTDMIASLRRGEIYNEGDNGAMSTMTAVLGRMATYSGQLITMSDALQSTLVESPVDTFHGFEDTPPVVPDKQGAYPIPVPGKTVVMILPSPPEA